MILGFKLEPGSPDVIVFDTGGRRPATAPESVLWAALQEALTKADQPAPTEAQRKSVISDEEMAGWLAAVTGRH